MGTATFEEPIRIVSNSKPMPMMKTVAKEIIKEKVCGFYICFHIVVRLREAFI
jgi:hypothetical protein